MLLWSRHRFQAVSFSLSTLEKKAFSNSNIFKSFHSGERFRNDPFSDRCSVDGSRIRNKTVSFLFKNGVVWTGSQSQQGYTPLLDIVCTSFPLLLRFVLEGCFLNCVLQTHPRKNNVLHCCEIYWINKLYFAVFSCIPCSTN